MLLYHDWLFLEREILWCWVSCLRLQCYIWSSLSARQNECAVLKSPQMCRFVDVAKTPADSAKISTVPGVLLKALCSIFPQAPALNTASSHKVEKKPPLPVVRHRFTPTDVTMALLAYIETRLCVDRELGEVLCSLILAIFLFHSSTIKNPTV